jgi:hypothetical protein
MRRRASSSPAIAIASSGFGIAAPARSAHRAAEAHDRNHAFDDQHPAPERSEKQHAHNELADEARREKEPNR